MVSTLMRCKSIHLTSAQSKLNVCILVKRFSHFVWTLTWYKLIGLTRDNFWIQGSAWFGHEIKFSKGIACFENDTSCYKGFLTNPCRDLKESHQNQLLTHGHQHYASRHLTEYESSAAEAQGVFGILAERVLSPCSWQKTRKNYTGYPGAGYCYNTKT